MKSYKWKKVSYFNDKHLRLAGLLHSGPETSRALIVCHGFTGSKEGGGRAVEMAEELARLDFAALLFDFSGCGESEGDFADVSLSGHISDLKSSVDFCLGSGFKKVITLGRSFGGAAALCHGGADQRVAGVCAWAAPADLPGVFSSFRDRSLKVTGNLVPLTGEGGTVHLKKSFFSDLERYDVAGQAALISPRPLLIVHGDSDTVVPGENARAVYEAAGEPKKLRMIREADHQFSGRHREVWEELFLWLKEHFPNSK